jgi:hypothetical protein
MLNINKVFRVSRLPGSRVQGFEVFRNPNFKVSRNLGFRV